ncbi:ion transporter [Nocardia sp. alder85J]|uniref:ion transporter n=1 Tax=Nocardia sp. alder85J TaxID=2862949 RepID=UPI001CD7E3E2|nr:ion transporter [Nocardia sp. alder85J]MCX4093716.1 ion transporter [Nocardia sp. alder85J]
MSAPIQPPGAVAGRRVRLGPELWIDLVMVLLAAVAVAGLGWIHFGSVAPHTARLVTDADYALCAVFALEFLWRWRFAGWTLSYLLIHWYDIVGLVPVTNVYVRAFRLLRLFAIGLRLARVAEQVFGDRVALVVMNRFFGAIVDTVKRPVTIAVLEEVAEVMRTGQYTRNLASALEENRVELDALVLELIRNDPQVGRVRYVPFHEDIIRAITDTSFRILMQALADPRVDELIGDVLRENVHQMRRAVLDGVRIGETPDNRLP